MNSYWTAEDIQHARKLGLVHDGISNVDAHTMLDGLDFEDIVRIENREAPVQLEPRRPVKESIHASNSAFALLDDDTSSDEEDTSSDEEDY